MIKRVFMALCCLALLCGCTSSGGNATSSASLPTSDYPASALDITVDKCPQTVVSLLPEVTDIIVALGSDAQLAAISDNCPQVREAVRVGTAFLPDTARIKSMGAELVFTSSVTGAADIEILRNAGIKVAVVEAAARYIDLPKLYKNVATLISGSITGVRNASNTFSHIDEKIKKFSNQSAYSVTAALLVSDGVTVPSGCITADLAGFAGVTLCDIDAAQIVICPEEIYEAMAIKYADKRVIGFDVGLLDRRGANMYDAIAALAASIKAR